MPTIRDLGRRDNIDVINDFVSLKDKNVVDVGCGGLTFTKLLLSQGARVLAIDPDAVQAEKNRQADPIPNLTFRESGGDAIPADDASADGVFFAYSLHHIPAEIYPAVFSEVRRVIKPGGFLYVIEPIDGPLNSVMKLYFNEDAERAAAQAALHDLAVPMFDRADEVVYHSFVQYESFEQYADHYANRSYNDLYSAENVRHDRVRAAFEKFGQPDYRFKVPKQAMCLQGRL